MKNLFLILCSFLLVSCATIFSRGNDTVTFKSNPVGASVYLNGKKIGKTPLEYTIDRSTFDHHYITLRKKGFKSSKFLLKKKITTAAIFNLLSVSSWATDATTGNMLEYQPNHYYIDLEGKSVTSSKKEFKEDFKFALVNHQRILTEIPSRKGEYLDSYAKLLAVPVAKKANFVKKLNENIHELVSYKGPEEFYIHTKKIAASL